MEYSYDPSSGEFSARVVESTHPVITARDDSPPQVLERAVGSFSVVPEGRDIRAEAQEDAELEIPPAIRARLKVQAEREDGPGSLTETVDYEHDLDTHETDRRFERRSSLDRVAAVGRGARERLAAGVSGAREAAAGALERVASGAASYESGAESSREERQDRETRVGGARQDLEEAQRDLQEAQQKAGASGGISAFANRVRGSGDPTELQAAQDRVRAAQAAVREAGKSAPAPGGLLARAGGLAEKVGSSGIDKKTLAILNQIKQAEAKTGSKGGAKRRGSSSKAKDTKRPGYSQPTIIVIRGDGPTGSRRYGGL